jgi:hypothetical protein
MAEQIEVKKKKRKEIILLTDYSCLDRNDILRTLTEIREELKKIFRNHIGFENAISPYELFYQIFKINPQLLDIYKRNYWYQILKRMITELRKSGEVFIINNGYSLFVLKSEEELKRFKEKTDRHIQALKNSEQRAKEWVKKQKWRNL